MPRTWNRTFATTAVMEDSNFDEMDEIEPLAGELDE
jgi:hypothetical protein